MFNLAGILSRAQYFWLHTICLFCQQSTQLHFRINGWSSDIGFLISDNSNGLLNNCCHPLNGKILQVQYVGLYPFIDQGKDFRLAGGANIEVIKMFSKKFNSSTNFTGEYHLGKVSKEN